ncbi:hypothetical protein D3C73_1176050 [compost metagenome]
MGYVDKPLSFSPDDNVATGIDGSLTYASIGQLLRHLFGAPPLGETAQIKRDARPKRNISHLHIQLQIGIQRKRSTRLRCLNMGCREGQS